MGCTPADVLQRLTAHEFNEMLALWMAGDL